jgi:folate-dependent phosphoribosylglycinamide formyltransferase PurN
MGALFRRPQGVYTVARGMTSELGPLRAGSTSAPIRCAILISGSGSGMQAMVTHQQTHLIALPEEADRSIRRHQHEQQIQHLLEEHEVELILLSGYMRLVSPEFVDRWTQRVINIHPSLLPLFPGAHAHRDVLAAGVEVSGCTVHYVDAGMDSGEILGQRRVPVFTDDDESSLAERVKIEEHQLYPEVIDRIVM